MARPKDRCERCGRPNGERVCSLKGSQAWRRIGGDQWYDSEGVEVDLIPLETSIEEVAHAVMPVEIDGDILRLCGECRVAYGDPDEVDEDGQGLLI